MQNFLPVGYQFSSLCITKVLGAGGFANTYLAQNQHGELVVVKELFPRDVVLRNSDYTIFVDPRHEENESFWQSSIEGFHDEIRVLGALNHSSIPRLLDAFQANNTYYLIQDFIVGEILEDLVGPFQQLSLADQHIFSSSLLITLLETLEVLHDSGVLHRDIKPSNVIIRKNNNEPVLIDFGGVRFQVGGITYNFHKRVGSEGYCSLEQATPGVEQGESSDLYSLAATMYKLLFACDPPDCTERKKRDRSYSFTELTQKGYDPNFLECLDRAYILDQENRFQTANEWLRALLGIDYSSKVLPDSVAEHLIPNHTCFIGRDPSVDICSSVFCKADSIVRKYVDGEYISRLHLQVNCYDDYWILINHSGNGSWVLENDGSKSKIYTEKRIFDIDVTIDLAGELFSLSDLLA